jgi:hypothetical protein
MTDLTPFQDPQREVAQQGLSQQAEQMRASAPPPLQDVAPRMVLAPHNEPPQQEADVFTLWQQSLKQDVALYQQAQQFAKDRGIDPMVADRSPEVMADMANYQRKRLEEIRQTAPLAYSLMTDPQWSKILGQEGDNLARAEISGLGWFGRQVQGQLAQMETSTLGMEAFANGGDPATIERLKYLSRMQNLLSDENDGWFSWAGQTVIQTSMFVAETAAVSLGTAAVSGPLAFITAPLAGGAFASSFEFGSAMAELSLENADRVSAGQEPIDLSSAAPALAIASVAAGAIDAVGFKAVSQPWRGQLVRGALRGAAKTFENVTEKQAWAAWRKNMLTSWGMETLTEGLQKAVMVAGDHVARANSDPAYGNRLDWSAMGEQMWSEAWAEMGAAAVGIAPLSIAGASWRLRRDRAFARASEHQTKKWTTALNEMRSTEVMANAPAAAAESLGKILKRDGIENVYVNVRDMRDALEQADAFERADVAAQTGASPSRVAREEGAVGDGRATRTLRELLPDVARQVDEAVDDTVDVKISVADFVEHFAGKRIGLGLETQGLLKFFADGMTKAERQQSEKALQEFLETEAALPQQTPPAGEQVGGIATVMTPADATVMSIPASQLTQDQNDTARDQAVAQLAEKYVASGKFPDTEQGRQDAADAAEVEVLFLQGVAIDEGKSLSEAAATEGIIWENRPESAVATTQEPAAAEAAPAAVDPDLERRRTEALDLLTDPAATIADAERQQLESFVYGAEQPAGFGGMLSRRQQAAALRQIGVLADRFGPDAAKWAAGSITDERLAATIAKQEGAGNQKKRAAELLKLLKSAKQVAGWKPGRLASMGMPSPRQEPTPLPTPEGTSAPMEASTRVPTAKGAEMQALDEKLLVDWSVMKTNPDLVSSNLDVLKDSDLGVAYRWDETQTPEQQIEGFIDFARDNLVWLHERMNPEWRARAKLWYVGARRIADWMAKRYNISPMQAAGILAVLSPQKNWFENVSMGDRIADILFSKRDATWTPGMEALWQRLMASKDANVATLKLKLASLEKPTRPSKPVVGETDEQWDRRRERFARRRDKLMQQYEEELAVYEERLEELEDALGEARETQDKEGTEALLQEIAAHKITKPERPVRPRRIKSETAEEFAERKEEYPKLMEEYESAKAKLEKQIPAAEAKRAELYAFNAGPSMQLARSGTLKDLLDAGDLRMAGYWVRLFDEAHNSRSFAIITPEGGMAGPSMTGKPDARKEAKLRWGSYNTILKAISIFEDGRFENIHVQVGGAHKVRNFYNNIYSPWFLPAATIDTHAIAAALMMPLSASDDAVAYGLGGKVKDARLGLHGGYAIFLDAYRRAAAQTGVQVREEQSITWEAIRGLFEAAKKSGMKKPVNDLWAKYRAGEATLEETREAIWKLAEGITRPEWVDVSTEIEPASSYAGESRAAMDAVVNERADAKPDPNVTLMLPVQPATSDAALAGRYAKLTDEQKMQVSSKVIGDFLPKVLAEFETAGTVGTTVAMQNGEASLAITVTIPNTANTRQIARAIGNVFGLDNVTAVSASKFVDATATTTAALRIAAGATPDQIRGLQAKLAQAGFHDTFTHNSFMLAVLPSDASLETLGAAIGGDPLVESQQFFSAWFSHDRKEALEVGAGRGIGSDRRRRLDRWREQASDTVLGEVNERAKYNTGTIVRQWRESGAGGDAGEWSKRNSSARDAAPVRLGELLGVELKGTEWIIPPAFMQIMRDAGMRPRRIVELRKGEKGSAEAFRQAVLASKKANTQYGAAVHAYPAEDYLLMRLFLTDDGEAGFALKKDGDIVSCFGSPSKRGDMTYMLQLAIDQGGWKADSFDTALPSIYAAHGLYPVARMPWDDKQKPEDWDYEKFKEWQDGRPDVLWYAFNPNWRGKYKRDQGPMVEWPKPLELQEANKPTAGKRLSSKGVGVLREQYMDAVRAADIGTPEKFANSTPEQRAPVQQLRDQSAAASGFVRAFHGTSVDVPVTAHAAAKPFTVFKTVYETGNLGAHFSVEPAVAGKFASSNSGELDKKKLFSVYLKIRNPLRLQDVGIWTSGRVIPQLTNMGWFGGDQTAAYAALDQLEQIVKSLLLTGTIGKTYKAHDAFRYSIGEKPVDPDYERVARSWLTSPTIKPSDVGQAELEEIGLQLLIQMHGYDSVVYLNRREIAIGDPGSKQRRSLSAQVAAQAYSDNAQWSRVHQVSTDEEFLRRIPEARDSYIVFRPEQIKLADAVTFTEDGSVIPLDERDDQTNTSILYSEGSQEEANIDINTRRARLLHTGNLKAHVHEQAHNMMRYLFRSASRPWPNPRHLRDVQVLLGWFGVADLATWNAMTMQEQERYWEAFAYSYEKYLFEGVAPTPGLRGLFDRLSRWIRRYYREVIENINVAYRAATGHDLPMLTDEVRAVMGRMLAAEQSVDSAITANALEPLFQTREQFPGSDDQWQELQELMEAQRLESVSQLTQQSVRQLQLSQPAIARASADRERAARAQRERLRAEVTAEVMEQPVYRLISYFKTGILVGQDGQTARDDSKAAHGHKLDRDAIARMPDLAAFSRIERDPSGNLISVTVNLDKYMRRGGADPEQVATAFGFVSNDPDGTMRADVAGMMSTLAAAPTPQQAIDARLDERMQQEFGNLVDPKARDQAVLEAVHGELRARLVAAEAMWLNTNLTTVAIAALPGHRRKMQQARDAVASIEPQLEAAREERSMLLDEQTPLDRVDLQRLQWLDLQIGALQAQRSRFAGAAESTVPQLMLAQAAAGQARKNLSTRVIGEINPRDFLAQERRSATEAQQALRKDITSMPQGGRDVRYRAASQAKLRQLLYQQMTAEALTIRREAEQFRTFVSRLFNIGQTRARKLEMLYVHAAQALLTEAGYAPASFTPERAEQIWSTVQQLDAALWAQIEPTVTGLRQLIASLPRQTITGRGNDQPPWRRMTVEQWRTLRDVIEALHDAAVERGEVVFDQRRQSFRDARDLLLQAISDRGIRGPVPGRDRKRTDTEEKLSWFGSFVAKWKRVEHTMLRFDGGTPGIWTKLIWTPINDAFVRYEARRQSVLSTYATILRSAPLDADVPAAQRRIEFRSRDGRLIYTFADMRELLGALLHIGNQSNKRKLLLGGTGYGKAFGFLERDAATNEMVLNSQEWDAFVEALNESGRLQATHWKFLQAVWDLNESLLPSIQGAHKRITGSIMRTVGRTPIVNRYGTFSGGYVPAKIDSTKSPIGARVESIAELQADMRQQLPMADDGFTRERNESVHEPLSFDLRMIESHIDQVVRYTEVAPVVNDVNRLLTDYTVMQEMHLMDPTLYQEVLRPFLSRALNNTTSQPHNSKAFNWLFSGLRRNTTLGKMFLNVPNALQNISGLPIALLRIPMRHWAHAIWSFVSGGWGTMAQNCQRSEFMRQHLGNQMSTLINEMRTYVEQPTAYGRARQWFGQHGLFLQGFTQNMVDTIVWNAAFDEQLATADASWTEDEVRAHAVSYADSVVRTSQLVLRAIDVSAGEAGTPFERLLTQFMSYFNSVAQANATAWEAALRSVNWNVPRAVPHLLWAYLVGLALPAVVGEALVRLLGRGFEEEDDDGRMVTAWFDMVVGSQVRFAAGAIPFGQQLASATVNGWDDVKYNDRMSAGPAIESLMRAIGSLDDVLAVTLGGGKVSPTMPRDFMTLLTMISGGLPFEAAGRPLGFAARVSAGSVEPETALDWARGLISGQARAGITNR